MNPIGLFPDRVDDYIFDGWEHERMVDVTQEVIADARGWDSADGLDIRSFVSIAASGLTPGDDPGTNCEPLAPQTWCAMDTNGDANIDDLDVEMFVALLLEGGPCAAPES